MRGFVSVGSWGPDDSAVAYGRSAHLAVIGDDFDTRFVKHLMCENDLVEPDRAAWCAIVRLLVGDQRGDSCSNDLFCALCTCCPRTHERPPVEMRKIVCAPYRVERCPFGVMDKFVFEV